VRQFLGLSGWFLAWNMVMKLMRASDVVVLGMLGSVESVTSYSLTKYTPEALVSLVAIVVNGVTPGLGGIIGTGNLQKAARVRSEMMSVTWLVATVVGAAVLLWNRSFVQLWVGAEYDAGTIPTACIMLMVMQFVLIRNDANIIDLTLNLRTKVLIGALSVLPSLILAGLLVGYFKMGITGLCVGFMVGRSILSVGYPYLIGHFLGVPFFSQLKSVLRPACITALFFILLSNLGNHLIAKTWLELVFFVGITVVVVSCFSFYSGLSGDQRQHLMKRVRLVTRPQ
jgi:O-antigen/teichoic acid export membrane protein